MPPLEFFDTTMNVLTPIVAALTCVFVGWVLGPSKILSECHTENGSKKFATFYTIMVKYAAPLLVLAIIISEVCRTFGLGGWSI